MSQPHTTGHSPGPAGESVTGAQSLIRSLEAAGADNIFGIPGRRNPAGVRPALRLREAASHPGAP